MNSAEVFVLKGTCGSAPYLTGLIWTIQRVPYPQFYMVSPDHFTKYEAEHTTADPAIIGPFLVVELVTPVPWAVQCPSSLGRATPIIGLGLVILIWVSTAVLQVPLHDTLSRGYDATAIATLVATNWIRTISWTVRSGTLARTLWQVLTREPISSTASYLRLVWRIKQ